MVRVSKVRDLTGTKTSDRLPPHAPFLDPHDGNGEGMAPPAAPPREPKQSARQVPKAYLNIKTLQDLSPLQLYNQFVSEEVMPWCRPVDHVSPEVADAEQQRFDCTITTVGSESKDAKYSSSSSGSMRSPLGALARLPRARSVKVLQQESITTATASAAPVPMQDDSTSEEDEKARQESMCKYVASCMGDLRRQRDQSYGGLYERGETQQRLASMGVEAYGRELGAVEAVSSLTPLDRVEALLQSFPCSLEACRDTIEKVTRAHDRERTVHWELIQAKLTYLVDEELKVSQQELKRALGDEGK